MKKKIKIGIIGCGFISQVTHIQNLSKNPNVEIVALADKRTVLLKNIANQYNIKKIYSNHKELIENVYIDAAIVVVRRVHTANVVRDLLIAGINVFSEKPMAQNGLIAQELVDIAKKNKLHYCIGFMRRYDYATLNLKNLIKSSKIKKLGQIKSVELLLIGGDDYCSIGPYLKTSEPRPLVSDTRKAPDFIPDKFIYEYEKFVNVCGHDINLIRYIFDCTFKCSHVEFNPTGQSFAILKNNDNIALIFSWRIDNNLKIWKEKLKIYFEFGEITLDFNPAFLKNTSGNLAINDYRLNKKNIIYGNNSWSFTNEIDSFINLLSKKRVDISNYGFQCLGDYEIIDSIWKNIVKINE